MKKLIVMLLLMCVSQITRAQETETTTYFFIRHAEKANDGTKNPHLTEKGVERAKHWAEVLRHYKLDAVYSTDYNRTRETALPTAKANNIETTIYNPRAFDLQKFVNETKGKTVLIVGHSNTTPMYVNSFIGKNKYGQIQESDYGNLYIITIQNNVVNDIELSNL